MHGAVVDRMQIAKLTKALVFSTDLSQLSVKKITTALEGQLER